ncbi:pentatricopeptide repeat-containing protein At5g66631 [Curcuma longa]|uniref:pentatricopeptide repeat-containing protein At5g66631 n=1 Tax=Curcuma longa TaxID=136217 RepID=UPI003D9EF398
MRCFFIRRRLFFSSSSAAAASAALRPFSNSASSPSDSVGQVSLYFRRARLIDALRLRLRSPDPPTDLPQPLDSFVAVHALRSAPSPESALSLFRSLPSPSTPILHALAKRLALARRLADLRSLLDAADAGSFPSSLPPSPLDRLRWFAAAGDLPAVSDLWSSIRSSSDPNRRSGRGIHPCTESYNIVMGLHADAGNHSAAVATFSQMIHDGANPNTRTYTIIIHHLVRSGHLEEATVVFYLLPSMRTPHTSKQYEVLAEAYASAGLFDEFQRLVKEMNSDGILPGRAMRAAIAKMRAVGPIEGTEEFVEELYPNDRIEYIAVSSEEEDDCEVEDEHEGDGDRIRLKPWMDPIALARAMEDWTPDDVAELEAARLVWTPRLVCKLLRAFKKPETAWDFFCWVAYQPGDFVHDRRTVSRMVSILARHGHAELVRRLLSKVKSEGIALPFATVRLLIDFYGLSKKANAAIEVFREAHSICGGAPLSGPQRLLLCSSLLRTMVKCRRGNDALDLMEEMMAEGVLPDVQTFSGLIQYFAGAGDLRSVHKLFGMVRQCGLEPDAYMYMILIQAYCKQDRAALALMLFREMQYSGIAPDGATKALLVKSLWKEGKLREAAMVEEMCDEVEGGLPAASPGHVWTVSAADFKRAYDIYASCFADNRGQT